MDEPRRVLDPSDFDDGSPPPRPAKAAPRASPRGSPESQRRLLSVASIDDESPFLKDAVPSSKQLQSLEATFEQLLNQTASSMRKDMVAREERISRRLETERKEQQAALFDIRRDLALQQSADLAAHEERLQHRLDDERREQKATFAELRHDISEQQELRSMLAALRRDVNNTQTAVSKLMTERSLMEPRSPDGRTSTKPLEQATAAAEAAIEDLRRELNGQREQLRLQASTSEGALASLRKELLALQSEEVSSISEHLHRSASELTRSIQEVSSSVESMGNCLRSELRREAERLGNELELERAQAEQRSGLQEVRGSVVLKRLEAMEARMENLRPSSRVAETASGAELEARVGALEASCRDAMAVASRRDGSGPSNQAGTEDSEAFDAFRVALDKTQAVADSAQRDILRLAKELAEQKSSDAQQQQAAGAAAPAAAAPLSNEQLRELSAEILKEVSRLDQRMSEELIAQVRSVEGSAQGGLASCRAALEEASRSIGHLTQDLARERSERCAALADLSCRAEDAAAAAERAERRASEEVARAGSSNGAPSLDVGDSASVALGTASKAAPTAGVIGSAEHVALAACVGELDAELRMEISERIQKVVIELRSEITKRVGAVEAEFQRFAGDSGNLTQVDARIVRLESARLDLRIGALESAWQRAASLVLTGRQAELGELRPPVVGEAYENGSLDSTCSAEAMHKITQLREMLREQAQRLSPAELGGEPEAAQHLPEQPPVASVVPPSDFVGLASPGLAHRGEFCGDAASQVAGSAGGYSPAVPNFQSRQVNPPEMADISSDHLDPRILAQEYAHEDDPLFQPLISDDLKERLEVLVRQVKQTLDRSQQNPDDFMPGSSQISNADFDMNMDPGQAPLHQGGSVLVQSMTGMVGDLSQQELHGGYPAMGSVETRVSRVTVGPPVLRSVSISAPRRAPSPHRSQSPLRHSVSTTTTTTTTRLRSPSPMRRPSLASGPPPPRVVTVSPVQPVSYRPEISAATPRTGGSVSIAGSWVGPAKR